MSAAHANIVSPLDGKRRNPIRTWRRVPQIGQKVSYQNATCTVGGDGLVACLDTSLGQHRFVLKPSGNVTF
jgi:hypothetical protein